MNLTKLAELSREIVKPSAEVFTIKQIVDCASKSSMYFSKRRVEEIDVRSSLEHIIKWIQSLYKEWINEERRKIITTATQVYCEE